MKGRWYEGPPTMLTAPRYPGRGACGVAEKREPFILETAWENFIETAPANATFELTDEEGNGLNAAIFAVETREAEAQGVGNLWMVAGAAVVATALVLAV